MNNYDYKYRFGWQLKGDMDTPKEIIKRIHKMQKNGYELFTVGDVRDFEKYLFRKKIKLKTK